MTTQSYPVHQPAEVAIPNFHQTLENIYVVSNDSGRLFCIKDLTLTDETLGDMEPGLVFKQHTDGTFEKIELDEDTKAQLTDDPAVVDYLDNAIIDNCTGKILYDVAWWAMDFNDFMEGFCNRHFEV